MITSTRPQIAMAQAAGLVRQRYGIDVQCIEALPGDRDRNFYIRDTRGREFTFKVASGNTQRAVLELQHQAMRRIRTHLGPGRCPEPLPDLDGQEISTWQRADGQQHFVRLLSFLPGQPLAQFARHSPALLEELGRFLGSITAALTGFVHPAAQHDLPWNSMNAPKTIRRHLPLVDTPERRALVRYFLHRYEKAAALQAEALRQSIIHNDANDYNILISHKNLQPYIAGIIDFGDMVQGYTVCELAIAAAYALLSKADPIGAILPLVRGYHSVFPLTEPEIDLLFHLICLRLCLSVCMSAYQCRTEPENTYLRISEQPAWAALEKLRAVHPRMAKARFCDACGLDPWPQAGPVLAWLEANPACRGPVLPGVWPPAPLHVFDLSIGSTEFPEMLEPYDGPQFSRQIFNRLAQVGARVGVGRYNEARRFYAGETYALESELPGERRTVHLGIDLFVEPGTPVLAPLAGTVHSIRENADAFDYGPTVILEHRFERGEIRFFTLYRHLSRRSLERLHPGQPVQRGERLGEVGDIGENGSWPPHLHFQLIVDLLEEPGTTDYRRQGNFPGVAAASQRHVWTRLCPNPNAVLGLPRADVEAQTPNIAALLAARRRFLGKSLSLSYARPLHIVRGWMQYLYDAGGRQYLDAVNNVPHVGHCHPRVVQAGQRQMAVLNTNTRYVHETILRYAERLCATMPEPLRVCYFVNSGSEANELALRLARAYTGRNDFIVLDAAYHGNTTGLVDISPYKFNGPGGAGKPENVHIAPLPDVYRGLHRAPDTRAGEKYAAAVTEIVRVQQEKGRPIAAFIAESLPGCAGQILLPDGYLEAVYRSVRRYGGICIADEVQVGFGRVGTHFWGFELQGVVPDIVTLGKPMGNGHPIGAVVTTPEIAAAFANGMEYFSTFGGNPVSCAIALAVLEVIEQEELQRHARETGSLFISGLKELQTSHPLLGDVRGSGLFLGVEIVGDPETRLPAAAEATYIVEHMRELGILISTDGPDHNVLKIKPPLSFTQADVEIFLERLQTVLSDTVLHR